MTKSDYPASNRKVSAGIAHVPSFNIDPIFSDFVLTINQLWSGLFFDPGFSWADLDDDKLPYTSSDFNKMECA